MDSGIDIHFSNPLRRALISSFEGDRFLPAALFTNWFRELGVPYFFLFRKNVSCTNLQFAELLALLRVHTIDILRRQHELHFVTLRQFLNQVSDTVSDLQTALLTPTQIADTFVGLYSELVWSMVVVEPFYGSCTAFYPPHLSLDLFRVCSESGYIHSCGINVYTRNLEDADEAGLSIALDTHLRRTNHNAKTFFAVYAHEDFTQYDRDYAADLREGLDDVKIFIEKYYLADKRFVSVLENIRSKFADSLLIPRAGDYRTSHKAALDSGEIDPSHTAWLIIDRQLADDPPYRGHGRFLICYDQLYKNDNPFHIFDENKPGWVAHTTIPHTLAGGMINITRPWWPTTRAVTLSDPFSGTGTVWLECMKFENVRPDCADIEPISLVIAEDNLRFFSLPQSELRQLLHSLRTLTNELPKLRTPSKVKLWPKPEVITAYESAIDIFEMLELSATNASVSVPAQGLEALQTQSLLCRLLFYLSLRTYIRHFAAFRRRSEEWTKGYLSELATLLAQIDQLAELKSYEEEHRVESRGRFATFTGLYSVGSAISSRWLADAAESEVAWPRVGIADAREANLPKVDVIVTDPPYGFNTESNYAELATLYSEAIKGMLSRIGDEGQIVLCLADRSHSGRQIAAFTTRSWVIHQIITEAQALGLEPIREVQIAPEPGSLFRPPYYWESERALRRSILHFRFRRRS